MRSTRICLIAVMMGLLPSQLLAQGGVDRGAALLGFQLGYGRLTLRSDQNPDDVRDTLAVGVRGGYGISSRVILGLELDGWLAQASDLNDPSKGESISNAMLFLHVFPLRHRPLYLRGAAGHVWYTTNRPGKQGGDGWGSWLLGAGYEIPVGGRFWIAPQLVYSRGAYSDVPDIIGRETGRGYDVVELSTALHWYAGRPAR